MRSLVVCCLLQALSVLRYTVASYQERRLYEDLMRDYNNLERPVANHSKPVTVYLKVSLQQIIDVDEKNQIVYVNAWLDYIWYDYKLSWDMSEYGNITDVRFPAGRIWKPDVLLYNSVDANFDSTYQTNMIVYSDGKVHWVPPGIFKISCKINIEWFPFDEQQCKFKFGSWTYDGYKLDLQPAEKGIDVSEYLPNGEWALPLTTVTRHEKFYDCCPEPYPDLTFYLHMRRRTLYYGFNLIMPCILTTLMTLLGFTLPPDAGEKITLQITVLLSICFFLSIVSDMSPPTSEAVPLLGIFFSCCMIVVTASTVFTVYVLNLHCRTPETHEMSATMRSILLYWLPWLIRMKRPGVKLTYASLPSLFNPKLKSHSESLIRNIKENESSTSRSNSLEIERRLHFYMSSSGLMNGVSPPLTAMQSSQITAPIDLGQQATLLILQRIYHELKVVTKRMVDTDREEQASNNWKFAAMVVDRLCLYVFTIFILASTVGIFWSAPYLVA
uniref:Nicotinic acetylcholine receptor alpha subunit 16 n=1 Tax=Necator americanus TaxID=51031 RepID=A0A7M1S0Z8_NECAM|nr:nicotinic acetylcholine receptor alpha subunit 16 [Necator americanus]